MTAPDALCWHEAGHALVAWRLGGAVRLVTLESELRDHEGHVEVLWSELSTEQERARCAALATLGGPIAELLFRGEGELADPQVLASWSRDWSELQSCLQALAGGPVEQAALLHELVDEVRRMLASADERERLARVADMLAAHGTLDDVLFGDAVR